MAYRRECLRRPSATKPGILVQSNRPWQPGWRRIGTPEPRTPRGKAPCMAARLPRLSPSVDGPYNRTVHGDCPVFAAQPSETVSVPFGRMGTGTFFRPQTAEKEASPQAVNGYPCNRAHQYLEAAVDHFVQIEFDCLPLRSLPRFDAPPDATPRQEALALSIRQAVHKHGTHNTFYLYNARCVFHLTNDPNVGMLEFGFHGTVLTDADDLAAQSCDLEVELNRDVCDWITTPVVDWFRETVSRAVQVEFDRYIAAGDLQKTVERMERLAVEMDAGGGFVGMGL